MIYCSLCKELIVKYEQDWKASGAISIDINGKSTDICYDCAVKITKELIDEEL